MLKFWFALFVFLVLNWNRHANEDCYGEISLQSASCLLIWKNNINWPGLAFAASCSPTKMQ